MEAIIAIAAALIGAGGTLFVSTFLQRLAHLEQELHQVQAEAEKRQAVLEEAARRGSKHAAYNVMAGLEDAMSLLVREIMEDDARRARLQTALGVLQTLRKDPKRYDPEKPNERL
jgi:heme exporter protein D